MREMKQEICTSKACARAFQIDEHEQAWFMRSGEKITCPYCGTSASYTIGSISEVRRDYVKIRANERWLGEQWAVRGRIIDKQRRIIAGLRGYINRMRNGKQ